MDWKATPPRSSRKIRNSKSEIRKKIETSNPKFETGPRDVLIFEIRISDFFRISDFGFPVSAGEAAHDEGGVLTTETETGGQRRFDRHFTSAVGNVIEIAAGIGMRLIDGRRQHAVVQRQRQRRRLHGAGGADQ